MSLLSKQLKAAMSNTANVPTTLLPFASVESFLTNYGSAKDEAEIQ